MADVIYNNFKEAIMNGSIDLDTDVIRVALVTSAYTPDQDTHDNFDDITNEITGTGYTAEGEALGSKAVAQDNTDNEGTFDAADTAWTTATFTARGAVIYKDSGTPSTSVLIAYLDFTSDKSVVAGTFTIQWAAEGILNLN